MLASGQALPNLREVRRPSALGATYRSLLSETMRRHDLLHQPDARLPRQLALARALLRFQGGDL
jgi:hypothetical protein